MKVYKSDMKNALEKIIRLIEDDKKNGFKTNSYELLGMILHTAERSLGIEKDLSKD
ncbi:MAG: hypothetical protein L3J17_06085 [Candidatus Jettenia sp.]|nr:MAG: hypothetical protein L3J17_06085 [Candidatus Jettenia sp.]